MNESICDGLTDGRFREVSNCDLLTTLQQWRFFPAMKGGVAIDSAFDVRIPVSVQ